MAWRPAGSELFDGCADAVGSLDADRRRRPEVDVESEVTRQCLGDDLLLDLSVERQVQLSAGIVLAQVDERILFREFGECVEHGPLLALVPWNDGGLQGGWGEGVLVDGVGGRAEGVADACGRESVDLGDLARTGRRATLRRASLKDVDRGDRLDADAELEAIPRS